MTNASIKVPYMKFKIVNQRNEKCIIKKLQFSTIKMKNFCQSSNRKKFQFSMLHTCFNFANIHLKYKKCFFF